MHAQICDWLTFGIFFKDFQCVKSMYPLLEESSKLLWNKLLLQSCELCLIQVKI